MNGNHWILIGVDIPGRIVFHYNTLKKYHVEHTETIAHFITNWEKECGQIPSMWSTENRHTPQQDNTHDCGPWILHISKCLDFNEKLDFSTADMQFIRKVQKKEIQYESIRMFKTDSLTNIRKTLYNEMRLKKKGKKRGTSKKKQQKLSKDT